MDHVVCFDGDPRELLCTLYMACEDKQGISPQSNQRVHMAATALGKAEVLSALRKASETTNPPANENPIIAAAYAAILSD